MTDPIKRVVLERFPKGADIEVHVSTLHVSDQVGGLVEGIDIRDYIPSRSALGERAYGRGVTLPPELVEAVANALLDYEEKR